MPRRSILSASERESLLALPDTEDELIRHYTFSEADLSLIRQRRGDANRLGVAVQLCLLRFRGQGQLPEIIDLHDRILGKLFNAAKNKHQQQFQASGKAFNAKVRLYGRIGQALIDAKQSGRNPFTAIEAVMSRDAKLAWLQA